MKKILVVGSLLCTLLSCKKDPVVQQEEQAIQKDRSAAGTAARLAPGEKVKLLKSSTVAAFISRSNIREKTFYAEVANLAYNKQVFVHHKMTDGAWRDFPLSYLRTAENGNEIWGWELNYGNGTPEAQNFTAAGFSDEFVLKYVVNGQTYWDNNNNKNYNISNYINTDGFFMQDGMNLSADTYRSYLRLSPAPADHYVQVYADVRNIAYNKEVKLVYTTNNWITVKYATLNYANTYAYGGDNFFVNSSLKNFEKWSAGFFIPQGQGPVSLHYAVSYKVNGVEYWDNNYGRNHTIRVRTQ